MSGALAIRMLPPGEREVVNRAKVRGRLPHVQKLNGDAVVYGVLAGLECQLADHLVAQHLGVAMYVESADACQGPTVVVQPLAFGAPPSPRIASNIHLRG
jgi:hypothetical protein